MLSWRLRFLLTLSSIFIPISITSSPTNSPQQQAVLYDIYPFIRVYKNGTVQRFIGTGYVPPTLHDPNTGVQSKDVTFSTASNLKVRLYLPQGTKPGQKLPLLIYYHGGGFFTESAFSPTYHNHLNRLVSEANVIAVSVNYRLAPEHPLPTAYRDSWLALQWILSNHYSKGNGHETWLRDFADFDRVYLGGDSAGANIAHHVSIQIGSGYANSGIGFQGMFLNCPYFLGKKGIGSENEPSNAYAETLMKRLWVYAYPRSSGGLDDPLANPGMDRGIKRVGCKRILVYVAGNDVLRFRGWYYKSVMERSGWNGEVKVVEVKGEDHVFNLLKPNSVDALAMLKSLGAFLNSHWNY